VSRREYGTAQISFPKPTSDHGEDLGEDYGQRDHMHDLPLEKETSLLPFVRVRRPVIRPDVQLLRLAIVAEGGD